MTSIARCPVCAASGAVEAHRRTAPLRTHRRLDADGKPDRFATIRLAACPACGHLYNAAFDEGLASELYADGPLTNVPVHPSMTERLRSLIDWLGVGGGSSGPTLPSPAPPDPAPPDIVEIGCGSGHLARILAPFARSVTLFEPNRSLTADMLPEPGIRLVSAPLPTEGIPGGADLVICRQVLEHLADPFALMRAIRASLREGGRAYLEVPNGDYVVEHAAFVDVHLQHVQYFSRDGFLHLARRAGLAPLREQWIKGRHDFGILFAAAAPDDRAPPAPMGADARGLDRRFAARIDAARAGLARLGGRVGLYGATAQAQAFVNAVAVDSAVVDGGSVSRRFPVVFDDTPGLAGFALFDPHHAIPVEAPSAERLAALDAVVVTAYLHDEAIARNLRDQGFAGAIATARPDPAPPDAVGMAWLYAPDGGGALPDPGPTAPA